MVYWSNEIPLSNKRKWALDTHLEESQNTYGIKAGHTTTVWFHSVNILENENTDQWLLGEWRRK